MKLRAGGSKDLLDARSILGSSEVNREMLFDLAARLGVAQELECFCKKHC